MIFGSAAISWLVVLFFHAFSSGSFAEVYMLFATTLWLTANFIWMDGKFFDLYYYISYYDDMYLVLFSCFNKKEEVTYQTDDIVTPKTEKMMLVRNGSCCIIVFLIS